MAVPHVTCRSKKAGVDDNRYYAAKLLLILQGELGCGCNGVHT